jgi:hypothetical protein
MITTIKIKITMQIIFGTKRLGKVDSANGSYQKYPEQAVVTLEGDRGHGKSRRFLFNALASEMLGLEKGDVQNVIFGSLVNGDEKAVLISNANNIQDQEGLTIYKTSKNYVAYDDSKEKGKAVSSSVITGDIAEFLGLNDDEAYEFTVGMLDNADLEACILNRMGVDQVDAAPTTEELEAETEGIDPFAVTETPTAPKVEGVNWENAPIEDTQPSQVSEGLTRATVE